MTEFAADATVEALIRLGAVTAGRDININLSQPLAATLTLAGSLSVGGDTADSDTRRLASSELQSRLNEILAGRQYDAKRALARIRDLVAQSQTGELKWAEGKARAEVLAWAARFEAINEASATTVEELIRAALDLDADHDVAIASALLLERKGEIDAALGALRLLDRADVRAAFVAMLSRTKGAERVGNWYDEQPRPLPLTFLTALGWYNLAVSLAELERWHDAIEVVDAVEPLETELADLAYLGGVLHAAFPLPAEHRKLALELNVFYAAIRPAETAEGDVHRKKAAACFHRAAEALRFVAPSHAEAALHWLRWLKLTDPDPKVHEQARQELAAAMAEPRSAVPLVPIAKEFGVDIDARALWAYLQKQSGYGGLSPAELQAQVCLAEQVLEPVEFAEYLREATGRLEATFTLPFLVFKRIEALSQGEQLAAARALLEEQRALFPGPEATRIEALLDAREGLDPTERFRHIYDKSKDLVDLKNLVLALGQGQQWTAARPLLEELLAREPVAENLAQLMACLERLAVPSSELVSRLQEHADLVRHSKPLRSGLAWALFHDARLTEAAAALDQSKGLGTTRSDHQLQVELALQTGQWERFGAIVDERLTASAELPGSLLLQLATLAAEADQSADRAMALASRAAAAAEHDPHLLVGAVELAYRLGKEDPRTAEWLQRARELSGEDGPVKVVELQELVETWAPARREQQQQVESLWRAGDLPLQFFARDFGLSMAELFIQIPRRNGRQRDPRRRLIIPTVSGARLKTPLPDQAVVAFDLSSIYLLWELGLLRNVAQTLGKILLPWETMTLLMEDRRRARFHQPSRISEAQHMRDLVSRGNLKLGGATAIPPNWLVQEVGTDLASLLASAQADDGRVVHPLPVQKLRSYRSEPAELHEFGEFLVSPHQLVVELHRTGKLDQVSFEASEKYLRAHNPDPPQTASVNWAQPLYLDHLSLTQLYHSGVLDSLGGSAILRIGRAPLDEMDALIEREHEGEETSEAVDGLRLQLRDLLADGLVAFLPKSRTQKDEVHQLAPTLMSLLENAQAVDLVCFDDRFVNKRSVIVDGRSTTKPVVTILDVLEWLRLAGHLTDAEHYGALDRLRTRGFAFLPPEKAELKWWFDRLIWSETDEPTESAELRNIRQALARWRELRLVQLPVDGPLLDHLQRVGIEVLREIWADEQMPLPRVAALSEWLVNAVLSPATDWLPPATLDLHQVLARQLAGLATPLPDLFGNRQKEYAQWVETRIQRTMMPGKEGIVTLAARHFSELLASFTRDDDEE